MKKIDDNELLRLAEAGTPQKDIAALFNVSEPAICKRLKQLRQKAACIEALAPLTKKEKVFVQEIAAGKSQTQAALTAFDVGSMDSAKTIGYRLMKDTDIQTAISAVMEAAGLDVGHLVKRLKVHVDNNVDAHASLKAVDMGLKLHDVYPTQKRMNLNITAAVDPVDLEKFRRR